MKNLKKPILIGTTLLLALGIAGAAAAHGHGRGHRGMFGMRMLRLIERLDLTEEQEVTAVRVRRKIREQARAHRAEMRASLDQVLLELEKPEPDTARLHRLVDEASARMNKLMHTSVDEYLTLHRTLSDEQRRELVDHVRKVKERRMRRHGRLQAK